jgi:uncharacterized protein
LEATLHDTAILLFAHTPAQEVMHKTFAPDRERVNLRLAEALFRETNRVALASGLPVIPVTSDVQQGNSFGERLANAFLSVFEAGYQRVICIGSDCPTLRTADLRLANQKLQETKMVLGPATDGGAYLIGLHIDSFDPEAFAMLNWQTPSVLQELTLYSFRMQSCMECISFLKVKSDVDSGTDLKKVLHRMPARSRLKRKLLAILLQDNALHTFPKNLLKPLELYLNGILVRSSPLLLITELL